ncbi:hypothetical protein ABT336_12180 [Micromonospora sp. NPDC000207]|uniref:hypothetical protein n=1 Tax=Micromonospora sp. NPDC000207 TaxID=3154246 RepID=UPI00332D884F
MDQHASLTIDAFRTTLTLVDGGRTNRHNILGDDDGDWNNNPTVYFRNAADRKLAALGHTRTGEWTYNASRDTHIATITN